MHCVKGTTVVSTDFSYLMGSSKIDLYMLRVYVIQVYEDT